MSILKTSIKLPPKCIDCRYFIPHYSVHPDEIVGFGRCSKYSKFCFITGEQQYELATVCRKMEDKCGPNAIYFKESVMKNKIRWIQMMAYQPYVFILFGVSLYSVVFIKYVCM